MKKITIFLFAIAIVMAAYLIVISTNQNESEQVVSTVTGFAKNIKNVPLSGDRETASQAVRENYSDYVAPDVLRQWENNPFQEAPGRTVSSPWPDHIEISSATKNPDGSYTVIGDIIELTSKEIADGGIAKSYNVTILLENVSGRYLITSYQVTNPD